MANKEGPVNETLIPQQCTRPPGHDDPCNGWPRQTCKGWTKAWAVDTAQTRTSETGDKCANSQWQTGDTAVCAHCTYQIEYSERIGWAHSKSGFSRCNTVEMNHAEPMSATTRSGKTEQTRTSETYYNCANSQWQRVAWVLKPALQRLNTFLKRRPHVRPSTAISCADNHSNQNPEYEYPTLGDLYAVATFASLKFSDSEDAYKRENAQSYQTMKCRHCSESIVESPTLGWVHCNGSRTCYGAGDLLATPMGASPRKQDDKRENAQSKLQTLTCANCSEPIAQVPVFGWWFHLNSGGNLCSGSTKLTATPRETVITSKQGDKCENAQSAIDRLRKLCAHFGYLTDGHVLELDGSRPRGEAAATLGDLRKALRMLSEVRDVEYGE